MGVSQHMQRQKIASLTTHSNTFKLTNEIHNSRPAYTKTNNLDSTTDKYEHVVSPQRPSIFKDNKLATLLPLSLSLWYKHSLSHL